MAMGRRAEQRQAQEEFWIAHTQWPRTVAHPFYQRLNQLLEERGFDEFVEGQCERFYAEAMGRPSLTPGRYFRLLLIGSTNNEEVGERVHPEGPIEAVTDKGYHSNDTLTALQQAKVRSYVSEPDRGRRRWQDKPEARQAVYDNRRRIHGEHGKQLLRYRGEFLERSFAHAYETGGMRRVYLRGQANVLKRVLIHLGGFNLSLIMRRRFGKGTPRGWQGFSADALLMGLQFWIAILVRVAQESTSPQMLRSSPVVRVTIVVRFAAQ